ncbi:NDR1/HIN1-like protein 13 [Olea europaea var. sylvestris]|uniref:NDR1/HIN1-like protein 13 n=1 Tax=Olea europaea var. sylvestris TaxID=158386 RepID=UPI000C1D81F5|nr:NDR1/HIN1-like protein 13 [Olea europaea var. sylvestris]
MEERKCPSEDGKDEPPSSNSMALVPGPLPLENSETYIVQIPRDQVYRVPPPENAKIVESHRRPPQDRKKKACFGGSCWWIILAFALIGLTVGISVGVTRALYKPRYPTFSVTKIHVKNLEQFINGHHGSSHSPEYDVTLKAHNPNERMDVSFKGAAGKASIEFKKQKIARGGVPNLTLDPNGSTNIPLVLHGTKASIENDIKKSLDGTKPKLMHLNIEVPMEVKSWAKTVQKDAAINCDIKVDSLLRKTTKILSQECQTNF